MTARALLLTTAVLVSAVAAVGAHAQAGAGGPPPRLEALWTLKGLADPERVLASPGGRFLYVSNVAGEADAVDGQGWISKVSSDGKMVVEKWAVGLDAPKGMALKDGRLYVADITRLVVIDTRTGKVLDRIDAPDAGFLNDVALLPDGRVIVSDSAKQRIYELNGDLTVWVEDPLLRSINGLLPQDDRLVISTMQGRLVSLDYRSRALTPVAEGLGRGDGVARLRDGSWLVSEWPGRLFHVRPDGTNTVLQDTREAQSLMNDFLLVGDVLYVPHMKPGELSAWRVRY